MCLQIKYKLTQNDKYHKIAVAIALSVNQFIF